MSSVTASTPEYPHDVFPRQRLTGHAQRDDGEAAIGMPGVAPAVLALELGVKAVHPFDRLHDAHLLQLGHQSVALGIDVRRDVMGDLPGGVA